MYVIYENERKEKSLLIYKKISNKPFFLNGSGKKIRISAPSNIAYENNLKTIQYPKNL